MPKRWSLFLRCRLHRLVLVAGAFIWSHLGNLKDLPSYLEDRAHEIKHGIFGNEALIAHWDLKIDPSDGRIWAIPIDGGHLQRGLLLLIEAHLLTSFMSNRIGFHFLLGGPRFELGDSPSAWTRYGKVGYAKPGLTVDNKHIFAAAWTFRVMYNEALSMNDVISLELGKIWRHRTSITRFAKQRRLKAIIDMYVEYNHNRPETSISQNNVARMAALNCSFSLEVRRLTS